MSDAHHDVLSELKTKLTADQYARVKEALGSSLIKSPRERLRRIPLLLPLLGTFGLVSTFYGFEKFLDSTILVQHPLELIGFGVITLLLTGAAATKL